ncbi:MAG TPA: LysM domain-containing protein [Candidatus Paceibacterota bacterium]|nr:LysM domain-containing protein [Candidatus Paceibacterota bacterium]
MAVFLAIGGLLSGLLWSAIFVGTPAGMVQERRVPGGPSLIPQAEGAEIDSAALTPQSAPFLASANAGAASLQPAENVDVLYGEGALKDSEPVVKTKTTATASNIKDTPVAGLIYQAVKGDTIRSISTAFGVPINTIVEFNPSVNFSPLTPGISIVIPGQNDL